MQSEYLKQWIEAVAGIGTKIEALDSDQNRNAIKAERGADLMYPCLFGGALGIISGLKYEVKTLNRIADRLEAIEREHDRFIAIFEALEIDCDEETLATLELIGKRTWAEGYKPVIENSPYKDERRRIRDVANKSIHDVLENEADYEQQTATEKLAAVGFVLNDEDQWIRKSERVIIDRAAKLKQGPQRTVFTWHYDNAGRIETGQSGDFHRLIELIAPKPVEAQ